MMIKTAYVSVVVYSVLVLLAKLFQSRNFYYQFVISQTPNTADIRSESVSLYIFIDKIAN